jgi:predicted transcriptional regulator YdeE
VLVATATSGLAPTYTSTGSACSVTSAGAVTVLAVGTCQITASQAGNSTYAAATPVTETLTVNPEADVITIPPTVPTTATVGSNTPIGATTTSGITPIYTSTTPTVCSVSSSGVVTTLLSGTCTISVTQPAAGNFAAATPQTVTLTVNAQTQTIQNFGTPITATYGGTAPVLAATATSGLAPTYASTGSACSVTSAGAVTILAVGTCQITASQAGNATYAAATPVSETLTVNPAADVITIPPTVPTTTTVGSNTPIGATTTSGVTPTYTSTTPTVCSVSATGVVTALTSGTCSVTVSQAAAGNYAAATPQTATFAVSGQSQTIQNFGTPITTTYGNPAPVLAATATSGLAPTYTSTGSACSVTTSGTVTILAVGTCQITASQAGNSTYAAATPVTETLTVNPQADVITIPPTVPTSTTVGTNTSIGATTTSGLPPTYTSTTPVVCSVSSSGIVTTLTPGTCSITVTQPAAGNFAAATPQTVNLSVSGGTNTITFPALPNTPFTSVPPVPLATATSGQPVTYSTSTAACSVTASGVVTFNSIGTCSITANQQATGNYAAATPVTQSFLITPGVDAIVVPPTLPATAPPGATVSIAATSTSGGPITYVSATPTACTVTSPGGVVTVLTAGACTLTLSQPAAGNFGAAPNQTVTLNAYDFTITANAPTSQTVVPGGVAVYTYALAPLAGQYPGANVTYTVTGLPPGATYTLTPVSGSVTQKAGPQTLTLTITTAQRLAMNHLRQTAPWSLALLLPLLLRRKLRRGLAKSLMLLFLLGAAAFTATGCADPNGFFGQPVVNYAITVTATSGGVTHSAVPVNLQVQ